MKIFLAKLNVFYCSTNQYSFVFNSFRFCYFPVRRHLCLETQHFFNNCKRCKQIHKTTFLISSSFSSVSFFVFLQAAFFFFTYIILKSFLIIPLHTGATELTPDIKSCSTPLSSCFFVLLDFLFFLIFPPK